MRSVYISFSWNVMETGFQGMLLQISLKFTVLHTFMGLLWSFMVNFHHLINCTHLCHPISWIEFSHLMKRSKRYIRCLSAPKSVLRWGIWWLTRDFLKISTSIISKCVWKNLWYIPIRLVFAHILIRNMSGQNAITLIDNKTLGDLHTFISIISKSAHMWRMMATGISVPNFLNANILTPW